MDSIDVYNTPAMAPPPGQVTNLVNPDSKATDFIITIVVCLAVSTVATSTRVFTRAYIMRKMQIEDYSLIIAELFFAAYAALTLRGLHFGEGRHLWDVSIANAMEFAKLGNIGEILYSPAMFFAKLSVLKQLERIFVGGKRDHIYWWIQAMIWVNAAFYLSIFIAFICACIPREKLWNPTIEGKCINTGSSILASSGINIVSDWSILVLPAMIINRLHMNTRRKLGVTAIFSVGLLACVASIVRLVYSVKFTQTADQTWAIAPVSIWSYAEIATVILSCSFPVVPKFLHFLRFGHRQPTSANSNSATAGSRFKTGKTRGYLLQDDSASKIETIPGKENDKVTNTELDNLDTGIRKTVTVKNEYRMKKDLEVEQQYPWEQE